MADLEEDVNDAGQKLLKEKLMKMDERNDTRKRMETKRRKDRYEMGSHAAQTEVFTETFREQIKTIELQLEQANEASLMGENRSQLTIRLDDTYKIIDSVKRYLTESSMFLTAFDNEQAKHEFQAVQNKFSTVRDTLLPKKKFGFNAKGNEGKIDKKEVSARVPTVVEQSDCGFRDENGRTLCLEGAAVDGRDLSVLRVRNCRVMLLGSPGSVYIHDVQDSTVICGPTTRSVFVSACVNCRFYFACQQARIHETEDTHFYIHVTSSAIVEACHRLSFAPYLLSYAALEEDFVRSSLRADVNNWAKVEDFCHLSTTVPSPNWSIMAANDQQPMVI